MNKFSPVPSDTDFMQIALSEATAAKSAGEWPFGAVIVKEGIVIAQNRRRETAEQTVLAHAELLVVGDACKSLGTNNLSGCTIYTTNEPCLMCASALFQAKIGRIVISLSRNDIQHLVRLRRLRIEDLAADAGYDCVIEYGLLRDESSTLFRDVEKNPK